MGTVLLVSLSLFAAQGPSGEVPRRGSFGPLLVQVACEEATAVYLESEFPEIFREPVVKLRLENTGKHPVSLKCRAEVVDYRGKARAVRPSRAEVLIEPGARKSISFATDPRRGVFRFSITLRGEVVAGKGSKEELGEARFGRTFAVVPPPQEGIDSASFFQVDGLPVWRPFTGALCRRMGVKVARVLVDPQGAQEAFESQAKGAARYDLYLEACCPAAVLSAGSGFMTRLPVSGTGETRWSRCCFVLQEGAPPAEILNEASRRVLQSFSIEGSLPALSLLFAGSGGTSPARLSRVVFRLPDGWGSYPGAAPYLYRLLDRGARLGKACGKAAALAGFYPVAEGDQGAALVATYAMASSVGLEAVSLNGPRVLSDASGRFRVDLLQVHAAMSYLLRGLKPAGELWPRHTHLYGCLFAPQGTESAKPFAGEDQRARAENQMSVAVVFAAPVPPQAKGELFLKPSADLAAYDITGNPTGQKQGEGLSVPLGPEPVFLTTRKLSTRQFADLLRAGEVRGLELITVKARPFSDATAAFPSLKIFVDNSDTRPLAGTVTVLSFEDKRTLGSKPLRAAPGEVLELSVPLRRAVRRPDGVYKFVLWVRTHLGQWKKEIRVPTAMVWQVSGRVDGDLKEWEKLPGVPFGPAESKDSDLSGAVVWAGWDASTFTVAVRVDEKNYAARWNGGTDPHSLKEAFEGSVLEVGLGFGAPLGRGDSKETRPPKGSLQDTDYLFLVGPAAKGAAGKAHCAVLYKPGMVWGECFLRGAQTYDGLRAAVRRAGTKTYYELAVPRSLLKEFSPSRGLRLGVVLGSAGKVMEFAPACGVPEYFLSDGSFLWPQPRPFVANQVWWGVGR